MEKMELKIIINRRRVVCLFLMLAIAPFFNVLSAVTQEWGFLPAYLRLGLYSIVLVYAFFLIVKYSVKINDLIILALVYLFYIIMFLFFSDPISRIEFGKTAMKLNYFYCLPISVVIVSRVDDWSVLFKNKYIILISDILIAASLLSKLFLNDSIPYMVFSYDILPICGITLVACFYYKKMIQIPFILISVAELLLFGSRGAFVSYGLCGGIVIAIRLVCDVKNTKRKINSIVGVGITIILFLLLMNLSWDKMLSSTFVKDSYVLSRLSRGAFMENIARKEIWKECMYHIQNMGMNVYGLFYDRQILSNAVYSHNWILESLLSMGWIFGTGFIFLIIYWLIKAFWNGSTEGRVAIIYFVFALFFRFFISGSAFSEGKFIIFLAAIGAACRHKYVTDNMNQPDVSELCNEEKEHCH